MILVSWVYDGSGFFQVSNRCVYRFSRTERFDIGLVSAGKGGKEGVRKLEMIPSSGSRLYELPLLFPEYLSGFSWGVNNITRHQNFIGIIKKRNLNTKHSLQTTMLPRTQSFPLCLVSG